jgi:hypothetical protein
MRSLGFGRRGNKRLMPRRDVATNRVCLRRAGDCLDHISELDSISEMAWKERSSQQLNEDGHLIGSPMPLGSED